MSNESIVAWKTDTAFLVVKKLPFEDFESAFVLAENYLSGVGGWNPDDPSNPAGPGEPVNGATPDAASDDIRDTEMGSVYNVNIDAKINISFDYTTKLIGGLSVQDILDNIEEGISKFIEQQLENTDIKYNALVEFGGVPTEGSLTTQDIRKAINDDVESGEKLIDPKSLALNYARNAYSLDNFWNITYLYTKENNDLFVLVEKYANDYEYLDLSDDRQIFLSLDPTTYEITGGALLTREPVGV